MEGARNYLSGVVEADLANGHGRVFVQVRPWGVNYLDIVLFVA